MTFASSVFIGGITSSADTHVVRHARIIRTFKYRDIAFCPFKDSRSVNKIRQYSECITQCRAFHSPSPGCDAAIPRRGPSGCRRSSASTYRARTIRRKRHRRTLRQLVSFRWECVAMFFPLTKCTLPPDQCRRIAGHQRSGF